MADRSRFHCASSSLALGSLFRRSQPELLMWLALGVAVHLSLTQIAGFEPEEKAAKPLTTQFVKRQPRLTKPLELKKRPQPKRRLVQRRMVSVEARMQREQRVGAFQPTQVLRGLARPSAQVGRLLRFEGGAVEPLSIAQAIESAKESKRSVDMSLEMMDVEALDTGKYHALVVQDPDEKRSIRGFCHLAIVPPRIRLVTQSGYTFEYYVVPGIVRLVAAMNQYTDIRTDILGRITLDDAELFKVPWVFFFSWDKFKLNDAEFQNLGRYLVSGGFVFADAYGGKESQQTPGAAAVTAALFGALATQGVEAALEKLPNSHPIYHCYFDFDGPPSAGDAAVMSVHPDQSDIIEYLEAIHLEGRVAALFSRKFFTHAWTFHGAGSRSEGYQSWDPKRPLQFGINTIIFALTQEGSITHRLFDTVSY